MNEKVNQAQWSAAAMSPHRNSLDAFSNTSHKSFPFDPSAEQTIAVGALMYAGNQKPKIVNLGSETRGVHRSSFILHRFAKGF